MVKCINQIIYSTLMLDTNLKKIQLSLVSILKITKIWNKKKKSSG